jgi:hypothetical protein
MSSINSRPTSGVPLLICTPMKWEISILDPGQALKNKLQSNLWK